MLEALLVEALRWRSLGNEAVPAGLLSGMQIPAIARALQAIHADVRANWTVAELASIAGMSRSTFSAQFGDVLGCAPIEYLMRWRMVIAKDALPRGSKTLQRIAEEIGYESTSAFSTAFRKRLGCPPGQFALRLETTHSSTNLAEPILALAQAGMDVTFSFPSTGYGARPFFRNCPGFALAKTKIRPFEQSPRASIKPGSGGQSNGDIRRTSARRSTCHSSTARPLVCASHTITVRPTGIFGATSSKRSTTAGGEQGASCSTRTVPGRRAFSPQHCQRAEQSGQFRIDNLCPPPPPGSSRWSPGRVQPWSTIPAQRLPRRRTAATISCRSANRKHGSPA